MTEPWFALFEEQIDFRLKDLLLMGNREGNFPEEAFGFADTIQKWMGEEALAKQGNLLRPFGNTGFVPILSGSGEVKNSSSRAGCKGSKIN